MITEIIEEEIVIAFEYVGVILGQDEKTNLELSNRDINDENMS